MCKKGHHVWRNISPDDFHLHADDACPVCGDLRFVQRSGGRLYPARVFYYIGLEKAILSLFADPAWTSVWKQGLDISNCNGPHASPYVQRLNRIFDGKVLHPNGGLYSIWDDGFTTCNNGKNSLTAFGIQSRDVPNSHYAREMNRRLIMLVGSPEPSNTSLILDELIEEANDLMKHGMEVTFNGRTFTYYLFPGHWSCDAIAREKLLQMGGPGRVIPCPACNQHATFLIGTTRYIGGYSEPVEKWLDDEGRQRVSGFAGDSMWQKGHENILEQMETYEARLQHVLQGIYGAKARLDEF